MQFPVLLAGGGTLQTGCSPHQLPCCHCPNVDYSSGSDGSQHNNALNKTPGLPNIFLSLPWLFLFFFNLTSACSNYFRGKTGNQKIWFKNIALSSSSWGGHVSCEIISMKWMAGCMHSLNNGEGQKGGSWHTGGWQPAVSKGLKPTASSSSLPAFP